MNVYDIAGRLVKQLFDGLVMENSRLTWDTSDIHGRSVSDGVYFIRLEDRYSGAVDVRKVLKVR